MQCEIKLWFGPSSDQTKCENSPIVCLLLYCVMRVTLLISHRATWQVSLHSCLRFHKFRVIQQEVSTPGPLSPLYESHRPLQRKSWIGSLQIHLTERFTGPHSYTLQSLPLSALQFTWNALWAMKHMLTSLHVFYTLWRTLCIIRGTVNEI